MFGLYLIFECGIIYKNRSEMMFREGEAEIIAAA